MTYYIYHIPGKKIGVTRDLNKRVTKQQGYEPHEYEILKETNLFILLNDDPEKIIEKKTIGFLKDQNIILCWLQNNKIATFDDTKTAIKWLL